MRENLPARHTIGYHDLPTFVFVFALFDERNQCLSWDETVEWAQLGLGTVPELYRGPWDQHKILDAGLAPLRWADEVEGFIVRDARAFPYRDFRKHSGKFVRADHVVPAARRWLAGRMIPNELAARS